MINWNKTSFITLSVFTSLLFTGCDNYRTAVISEESKIIEMPAEEVNAHWPDYIDLSSIDNTSEKEGYIYPDVMLSLKKVTEKEINEFKCNLNYNYAGDTFSKEEIISFPPDSDKMKLFNAGEILSFNFKYPKLKKVELKEGEEFFIPLHDHIAQSRCTEIKYFESNDTQMIDTDVNVIDNNLSSYTVCEDTILGQTTEGTGLRLYFDAGKLVKAWVGYYGEMGKTEENIFLKNNQIIFAETALTEYDKPMYYEDFQVKSTTDDTFYFKDESLAPWLKEGIAVDRLSAEFKSRAKEWQIELESLDLDKKQVCTQ